MKKIIVFGASGDTGRYLIKYFMEKGIPNDFEIIACGTRQTDYFRKVGIQYFQIDITDKASFEILPKNVYAVISEEDLSVQEVTVVRVEENENPTKSFYIPEKDDEIIMKVYEIFKEKVFQLTKIDLSCYKERQMKRRIDALITKSKVTSYDEYVQLLRTNQEKLEEFVAYLTINVSEFYRNPDQWKLLENEMLS